MLAGGSARKPALTRLLLLGAVAGALLLATTGTAHASAGSLDPSFGGGGIAGSGGGSRLFGTAVQGDGKVLAVGEVGTPNGTTLLLARFTPAGSLDRSFGAGGLVRGPAVPGLKGGGSVGYGVAIQADGKVVVVGKATTSVGTGSFGLLVERYNPNGTLDSGFGGHGLVDALTGQASGQGYAVAIQPDGKILATGSAEVVAPDGTTPHAAVVRLNANGSLDPSFGSGGADVLNLANYSYALAVALQPDGGILIAGSQAPGQLASSALIARLTPSGTLDPAFAGTGSYIRQLARGGAASSAFNAVAVQRDGNIVAAGDAQDGTSAADTVAMRLNPSGAPDGKFGAGGLAYTPSAVNWSQSTPAVPGGYGILIAPNGDLVIAGSFANSTATYATLWALTPTGSLDRAFGHGGAAVLTNSFGYDTEYAALALSPVDDGFVAAGDTLPPFDGAYSGIAARYLGFPGPPPLQLKGLGRSYRTSAIVSHGLKLTVACPQACAIKLSLTMSAATARKLRLRVRRNDPVTIATATATLRPSASRSLVLRLSRGVGRALLKRRSVSLVLVASVTTSATHKSQVITKNVTLRR